jgi:hypothetical protein
MKVFKSMFNLIYLHQLARQTDGHVISNLSCGDVVFLGCDAVWTHK